MTHYEGYYTDDAGQVSFACSAHCASQLDHNRVWHETNSQQSGITDQTVCESCGRILDPSAPFGFRDYVVLYRYAPKPICHPLAFHCVAEDGTRAEELCGYEHPKCEVLWVFEGDDERKALADYYGDEGADDDE